MQSGSLLNLNETEIVNQDSSTYSITNSIDDLEQTNLLVNLSSKGISSSYQDDDLINLFSSKIIIDVTKDDTSHIEEVDELKNEHLIRYSEQFKDRETHFFILSQSGKPIFSRYGSDSQTAAFIGVMQAMISFVEAGNDHLNVMIAGKHTFVFLVHDNIILVAVSSGTYVPRQLKMILDQIYYQIISMLTLQSISMAFKKQPSLDLRRLLVGIDRYMHGIIEEMESDLGPLLKSVAFVTMEEGFRLSLMSIVCQSIKISDVVFALLLFDEQLLGIVRRKDYSLHPMDIRLLLNVIRNSIHFNTQICWLPICLPRFNPDGYFYAHVSYIVPRLSLVILTVNAEQFDVLQNCHNVIRQRLMKTELVKKIQKLNPFDKLWHSFQLPELRHFIYKWRGMDQYLSYWPNKSSNGFNSKISVGRYLPLHHLIHYTERRGRLIYQSTDSDTILAWRTERFELYATFDRIGSKSKVMEMVRTLLDVINKYKRYYFVGVFPTF